MKYIIQKTDGTPVDPSAVYWVLRIDNHRRADYIASREALKAYIRESWESDNAAAMAASDLLRDTTIPDTAIPVSEAPCPTCIGWQTLQTDEDDHICPSCHGSGGEKLPFEIEIERTKKIVGDNPEKIIGGLAQEVSTLRKQLHRSMQLFGQLTLECKKLQEQRAEDRALEFSGIVLERETLHSALIELRRWVGDGDCSEDAGCTGTYTLEYANAIAQADRALVANNQMRNHQP